MVSYKASLPPCFRYVGRPRVMDENVDDKVIWDGIRVEQNIRDAFNAWYRICDPSGTNSYHYTNPYNTCCLEIVWSTDEDDQRVFIDGRWVLANTRTVGNSATSCEGMDCDRSKLIINQCRSWTTPDATSLFSRGFYNVDDVADDGFRQFYDRYHFSTVLEHEIGHWFSFPHESEADCSTFWDEYDGIMDTPLDAHQEWEISADDICHFKKLYCCNPEAEVPTGITDARPGLSIELVPNPATATCRVRINGEAGMLARPVIRLIDAAGTEVMTRRLQIGVSEESIDLRGLNAGTYLIEVRRGGVSMAEKLVIER